MKKYIGQKISAIDLYSFAILIYHNQTVLFSDSLILPEILVIMEGAGGLILIIQTKSDQWLQMFMLKHQWNKKIIAKETIFLLII